MPIASLRQSNGLLIERSEMNPHGVGKVKQEELGYSLLTAYERFMRIKQNLE
jgi:hypothetical protein